MNNLLILYPQEFKSYSKFCRKIDFLTQNLPDFTVVYLRDFNKYIKKLFQEKSPIVSTKKINKLSIEDITHAIIFDDGEEFFSEREMMLKSSIKLRIVDIKITRVVNIKNISKHSSLNNTEKYEYIGRGSYWGNPYAMNEKGDDRDEVIRKYKYDFDSDFFPKKDKSKIFSLLGKRLGCFCKPQACHGDILANFLNEWDDGE